MYTVILFPTWDFDIFQLFLVSFHEYTHSLVWLYQQSSSFSIHNSNVRFFSFFDLVTLDFYIPQQFHLFIFCDRFRIMLVWLVISLQSKLPTQLLVHYYCQIVTFFLIPLGKYLTLANYMVYSFHRSVTQSVIIFAIIIIIILKRFYELGSFIPPFYSSFYPSFHCSILATFFFELGY